MNRIRTAFLFFFLIITGHKVAQELPDFFYNDYNNFSEKSITSKRLKHTDVVKLLDALKDNKTFEITEVGHSLEGKKIELVKFGSGPVKVFCWSQMHGDESTATMALFDILNYFRKEENSDFVKMLQEKLTIYILPMLNPDGAEKYTRRNALYIDLNRDALRLQSPESKILRSIQDSLKPEFGFNLHDQSTLYSAGHTQHAATISFLAPAFNYAKDMNDVRTKTMKVIAGLYEQLNKYIPGHIGRYSDDFEPRAFGDNFVKWGTSSVLIESGGWRNDIEKQFIRKLNYTALLTGYWMIANGKYNAYSAKDYEKIPENRKALFDLLVKRATYFKQDKPYIVDIGINREEKNSSDFGSYYFKSKIDDIGDLSVYHGYDELNCSGMRIEEGRIFPETFSSYKHITEDKAYDLLSKGYTGVVCDEVPKKDYIDVPINIYNNSTKKDVKFSLNSPANFLIYKDDILLYVILNGFVFDLKINKSNISNALIFN